MAPNVVVRAGVKLVASEILQILTKKVIKLSKPKRIWVRDWIARRSALGASARLLKELTTEDTESYTNFMRLSPRKFEELLSLVELKIKKSETWMRPPISPRTKLEVTLRYLASGDSLSSLQYLYRIPKCTISKFLPVVLSAIYEVLRGYLKVPTTQEEWSDIQRAFSNQWNFPNCCGAIDGKHVQIQRPPNSVSEFYNYKGTYSIILFALVDADYCFKYIEVGANGRASDSTIFRNSDLNEAMLNGTLNMPSESIILGDDAFPLRTNLFKPYTGTLTKEQRIFNYRLSRARRVVENAFGILASRFQIFKKPIILKSSTVDFVIKASCALHNWLRMTSGRTYIPPGSVDREDTDGGTVEDGLWRREVNSLPSVNHLGVTNYSQDANIRRNHYAEYFAGEGAVHWQNRMIGLSE